MANMTAFRLVVTEALDGAQASEFTARRLDMTRNSLTTTWRQIRSRLK